MVESYSDYLRMTDEELEHFIGRPTDGQPNPELYWKMVCDAGYRGVVPSVPYERIIAVARSGQSALSEDDQYRQAYYCRRRVPSEMYHGRAKKLFEILCRPYGYHGEKGEEERKLDVENCIMLTNEHIVESALSNNDGKYYHWWLQHMAEKDEAKRRKHAEQQRACEENKRRRILEAQAIVDGAPIEEPSQLTDANAEQLQREIERMEAALSQLRQHHARATEQETLTEQVPAIAEHTPSASAQIAAITQQPLATRRVTRPPQHYSP